MLKFMSGIADKTRPYHDPRNPLKTRGSTEWDSKHHCAHCGSILCHEMFMARTCISCGKFSEEFRSEFKTFRKIWTGEKWLFQSVTSGSGLEVIKDA